MRAVLWVERLNGLNVDVAKLCHLLHVKITHDSHRIGSDGQLRLHGADIVLTIIVHNIVGRNKSRHVTTRLAWQVGIDRPVITHAVGTMNGLIDIRRTAVVGSDDEVPITIYLVEVAQVARCCPTTL